MMAPALYVDDGDELARDVAYSGPAWYAIDLNGILAGPFDDGDQADWWLNKALRV